MPKILGVQTLFPSYSSKQDELAEFFIEFCSLEKSALVRKIFSSVKVENRHHALPGTLLKELTGFGERNSLWQEITFSLTEKCCRSLLKQSEARADEIGHIFFTSVTGISAPSMDSLLVNRLRLNSSIKRTPIFGLGCLGGAALVSRAADYLIACPDQLALIVACELCSLTLQADDRSMANIVGSALFGDGAASVLLAGDKHPLAQNSECSIIDSTQSFFYDTEGVMGWDIKDTGFKIVLSTKVPIIAKNHVSPKIIQFLGKHKLKPCDLNHWIAHPGGPKVISAFEESLGLKPNAFELTRKSLTNLGNLSSVSVLNVLQETLKNKPKNGEHGLLFAMGPAFCAEMVLLSW